MKVLRILFTVIGAVSLVAAILVACIQICCFGDMSFYRDEYKKYDCAQAVGMDIDDLMDVTVIMTEYLQGKRETLTAPTTMWGEQRDFFNDRERAHMVDVQALNASSVKFMVRAFITAVVMIFCLACMITGDHPIRSFFKHLCWGMIGGTALFAAAVGIGAAIVSTDFDKYWRMFHSIFFTNDLWLLDPNTDMLINIVPLGFFSDLVAKIAVMFACMIGALLLLCIVTLIIFRIPGRKKSKSLFYLCLCAAIMLPRPMNVTADGGQPQISSAAAIVIERTTGTVLYAKNETTAQFPASTTKVMTALLAFENLNLNDTLTFSKKAINSLPTGASHIGMKPGEQISIEDAMYGLLLPSANEVANALAEAVSGSMNDFAKLMNERAAQLGCVNTSFANPSGLHDSSHYTCAADLARIFSACIAIPEFVEIDSTATHIIPATNLVDETRPMRTTHEMMRPDSKYYDDRVICGKTGHTAEAGACLITYAASSGLELIVVTMHAENGAQYTDTSELLDYCFSTYSLTGAAVLTPLLFSTEEGALDAFAQSPRPALYSVENTPLILPKDLSECTIDTDIESGTVTVLFNGLILGTAAINKNTDLPTEQPLLDPEEPAPPPEKTDPVPYYIAAAVICAVILTIVLIILFSDRVRGKRAHRRKTKREKSF